MNDYKKVKYSVTVSMPGCLADSISYHTNFNDACESAKWYKNDFLDSNDYDDTWDIRVSGNIKKDHMYIVNRNPEKYIVSDGWYYIEIHDLKYENLLMDEDGRISDDNGQTWYYVD